MNESLRLTYTPELTLAGITRCLAELCTTPRHDRFIVYKTIYDTVAATAVELALRRTLTETSVPFNNYVAPLAGSRGRAGFLLGRRPVRLVTHLVHRKTAIQQLKLSPQALNHAMLLVSSEEASIDRESGSILVFAYLLGLIAWRRQQNQSILKAGLPGCWLWLAPEQWRTSMGQSGSSKLAFDYHATESLAIEIAGIDAHGKAIVERLLLHGGASVESHLSYLGLSHLKLDRPVMANVRIQIQNSKLSLVIPPSDWKNIWIYGMQIILPGYLPAEVFGQLAHPVPAGSNIFPHSSLERPYLGIPASQVSPIDELFTKVRSWHKPSRAGTG